MKTLLTATALATALAALATCGLRRPDPADRVSSAAPSAPGGDSREVAARWLGAPAHPKPGLPSVFFADDGRVAVVVRREVVTARGADAALSYLRGLDPRAARVEDVAFLLEVLGALPEVPGVPATRYALGRGGLAGRGSRVEGVPGNYRVVLVYVLGDDPAPRDDTPEPGAVRLARAVLEVRAQSSDPGGHWRVTVTDPRGER